MKRKKLKKFRVDHDLTQQGLATSLGVTTAYINTIETGKKDMSLAVMKKFKEVYGFKTLDDVIELLEM